MSSKLNRRMIMGSSVLACASSLMANEQKDSSALHGKPGEDSIKEPARSIPVVQQVDVCVLGGSCTGVFAAVRAAQMGATVAIIEKQNAFGGVAASGMVNIWHTLHTYNSKDRIIGGLTEEVLNRLDKIGAMDDRGGIYRLNTEELKIELDRLILEHEITPYFHTSYVAPSIENGHVQAVLIENKNGRQAIRAKMFVDATGDGDLMKDVGVPFEIREGLQPPTTCSRVHGMPTQQVMKDFILKHGAEFGLQEDYGWSTFVPGVPNVDLCAYTHVFNTNAADAGQLTAAEVEGRRQVRAYMDMARKYGGDKNNPQLVSLPSYIGIRESRSFEGNYRLMTDDVINCVRFPDAIANGNYKIDVHDPKTGKPKFVGLKGDFYQVPLRSLVSDKAPNVIMAGRMISTDRNAFGAIRVMVNLNQVGEAAGVTAAMALHTNKTVNKVDASAVRKELSVLGAVIV